MNRLPIPKKTLLLILFLVVVFILLMFFLFFKRNSPQSSSRSPLSPTIYPNNKNITPSLKKSPTFNTAGISPIDNNKFKLVLNIPEGFSLPPTLPSIKVTRTIDEAFMFALKNRFGLEGNPIKMGSTLGWQSKDAAKILLIDPDSGFVQFSNTESIATKNLPTTDQNRNLLEIAKIAEDELAKLNIINIAPNTATIIPFRKGHGSERELATESNADYFDVSFLASIGGTPLYYQNATKAEVLVQVDRDGAIRSIRFFHIKPTEVIQQVTLPGMDFVKQKLNNNDFTITRISEPSEFFPQSGTITLTSIKLVYFDDKENQFLFPVALLEGKLLSDGRDISIFVSLSNP